MGYPSVPRDSIETTTATGTRRRHHHHPTSNDDHHQQTEVARGDSSLNSPPRRRRNKKKRRNRNNNKRKDDIPFYKLFLSVGITLFSIICIVSFAYRTIWPTTTKNDNDQFIQYDDDDDVVYPIQQQDEVKSDVHPRIMEEKEEEEKKKNIVPETPPPIPIFDLSDASKFDAFGILDHLHIDSSSSSSSSSKSAVPFWKLASKLRQQFVETYGGENLARMILDKGLTTFFDGDVAGDGMKKKIPQDVISTACRFQRAEDENRSFRLSFGGYSVTAGRGNLFQQSFPFQLQNLLNDTVQLAGNKYGIEVRNAAIGGVPSFPYGWCLTNFWGTQPVDVISWDYSMNEAGGVPHGLEAYVRHILATYSSSSSSNNSNNNNNNNNNAIPKLIVKDTHMASLRRDVLHEYSAKLQLLEDPVVIHTDPATKVFLDRSEDFRPVGFQQWRKFGSPHGAPGQALHHPAVKEHELIGWMLAMHFLTALEYKMAMGPTKLSCPSSSSSSSASSSSSSLPPPVSGRLVNSTTTNDDNDTKKKYDPILFGHETTPKGSSGGGGGEWTMNPIQCRTTFQPILTGDLSQLIVSGTTAEDLDILLPKSQQFYNQGWTLDMSEGEKAAKRKLSLYKDGLGFIDSKEAYYGIYESPRMTLLLPYTTTTTITEKNSQDHNHDSLLPNTGDNAKDWFESIVICQVNEKRNDDVRPCNFGMDISFVIGGVNITNSPDYMMKDPGTLYLGKQVCSHVPVPDGASLTSHNELATSGNSRLEKDQIGLLVEIFVNNPHIVHISQACSISHIVWEERTKKRQ